MSFIYRTVDKVSNIFTSPRKPATTNATIQDAEASSPLKEKHPHRVQKSRQRPKTYSRADKKRVERIKATLSRTSLAGELNSSPAETSSRRQSIPVPFAEMEIVQGDDPVAIQAFPDANICLSQVDQVRNNDAVPTNSFLAINTAYDMSDGKVSYASQPPIELGMRTSEPGSEEESEAESQHDVIGRESQDNNADEDEPIQVFSTSNEAVKETQSDDEELCAEEKIMVLPPADEKVMDEGPEEPVDGEAVDENLDPEEETPEQFNFTNLLAHRWVGNEIEVKVAWHKDHPTWEPETNIHHDAADALFKYWKSQGGHPENPNNPGLYNIFAIRKHSKDRRRLFVEWTGYEASESSWVSTKMVRDTAPDVVAAYWLSLKK